MASTIHDGKETEKTLQYYVEVKWQDDDRYVDHDEWPELEEAKAAASLALGDPGIEATRIIHYEGIDMVIDAVYGKTTLSLKVTP
jgi:hypothetical protein